MATGAFANGATAAHLAWNQAVPKLCKKERGRYIDTERKVCEGKPSIYKGVRFVRCDSCLCTRNKGFYSHCRQCGVPPPSNVVEQQVLVQRNAATAGQLFGQLAHVPTRPGPLVVGGAGNNNQPNNATQQRNGGAASRSAR